eukprot:858373-Pleurochrysis_carterae.AAC.1
MAPSPSPMIQNEVRLESKRREICARTDRRVPTQKKAIKASLAYANANCRAHTAAQKSGRAQCNRKRDKRGHQTHSAQQRCKAECGRRKGAAGPSGIAGPERMCVWQRACERACERAWVRACVRSHGCAPPAASAVRRACSRASSCGRASAIRALLTTTSEPTWVPAWPG